MTVSGYHSEGKFKERLDVREKPLWMNFSGYEGQHAP